MSNPLGTADAANAPPTARLTGVLFALAAGIMWGLVFVAPSMLADYPPVLLTMGRYLAFGLIALPLGWYSRPQLALLSRADWLEALKLAAVGNLIYYLFLSGAIQLTGGPLATMIIGTLPVVIAIAARLRATPEHRARDGQLPWMRLLPSLLLLGLGIACVNAAEAAHAGGGADGAAGVRWLGVALALGAVVCWTWYPLRNADWLRAHRSRSPGVWATAQGLATLPLALTGYGLWWLWQAWLAPSLFPDASAFPMPLGPRPWAYVGLMLLIGLFSSWLGTLCWNEASQRLPPALVGQLIVFETLAALTGTFLWRGQWPPALTLLGAALLVAGVVVALRGAAGAKPAPAP